MKKHIAQVIAPNEITFQGASVEIRVMIMDRLLTGTLPKIPALHGKLRLIRGAILQTPMER